MWILLVEDDSKQAALISNALRSHFQEVEVRRKATESEFRDSLPDLAADAPALIVMDVMLRWCDPSENMPPMPPECEDFSVAGVRCCKLLKANDDTKRIPIIVLTVLDKNGLGLPPGCVHVPKTSDFKALIAAATPYIRRVQEAHR